ncbi:MAG: BON domain-containing protein [Candidatus Omnitrophica bacterium]|nr:BON domain-containing protein [Candidatus Omnitrophota bacterium]MDD4012880.1 BON domain-containing protein [Candidatus Omnitrophota bacterium]
MDTHGMDSLEIVKEELEEHGIDADDIEIDVEEDGSRVVIRGRVSSRREKDIVVEAVEEAIGADEIINSIVVARHADETGGDEDEGEDEELLDDDDEEIGTDDMGRSVENGIPYIPPERLVFREESTKKPVRRRGGK